MAYYDHSEAQKAQLKYVRKSMNEPLLEREHELELARRWKNQKDEKALHELIKSYTRLVVAVAAKFKNYGLPMSDLIQEGNIGLMEAAARFEPELENRFSTYATWWIKAQIQDYILRNWSIVRMGTTAPQKALFFNLRRLRAKIDGEQARDFLSDDAVEEIATQLGVQEKDVRYMEGRMGTGDHSLNATIGHEGESAWQDFLKDESPNPEDIVIGMKDNKARSKWLNEALSTLSERERNIITKRNLLSQHSTLEDIGKELGISKERVRQLEARAMDKLKTSMQEKIEQNNLDVRMLLAS